jgi:hypothetical protein
MNESRQVMLNVLRNYWPTTFAYRSVLRPSCARRGRCQGNGPIERTDRRPHPPRWSQQDGMPPGASGAPRQTWGHVNAA